MKIYTQAIAIATLILLASCSGNSFKYKSSYFKKQHLLKKNETTYVISKLEVKLLKTKSIQTSNMFEPTMFITDIKNPNHFNEEELNKIFLKKFENALKKRNIYAINEEKKSNSANLEIAINYIRPAGKIGTESYKNKYSRFILDSTITITKDDMDFASSIIRDSTTQCSIFCQMNNDYKSIFGQKDANDEERDIDIIVDSIADDLKKFTK